MDKKYISTKVKLGIESHNYIVLYNNGKTLVETYYANQPYKVKINLDEIETVEYKTENGTRWKYITFKKGDKNEK